MKQLEERLVRELGEIADRATTSHDALALIQSRASSYHSDDEEEVVVMLAPEVRKYPRHRWLVPAALGTVAAVVLALFGLAVLRSEDDDIATVEPTLPTETPATVDPTTPTEAPATVDPTLSTEAPATVDPTLSTEAPATVDPTIPAATGELWTRPPLDGEWVEVAVGEPWGPAFVGEIDALPGGGYVAVTLATPWAAGAEEDGLPISTVMWSPDGVEWFDGDPEQEIGRPPRSGRPQLAVASDRVAVIDGTDFSDHVPLAIGDPRTASWNVVALDYTALDGDEAGVSMVSLAANDDEVLVAAYSAHERPAGMMDVVTWVVDPTTGTWETDSFTVANRGEDDTGAPLSAWVDGSWILFAYEDPTGIPADRRHTLWTSSDGLTWSQADLPSGLGEYYSDGLVCSLADGPMGVVAVTCPIGMGLHSEIWYSADGLEWAKVPLSQIAHGGTLTAVGDYGFVIDGSDLQLVAADGSGLYQMSVPFADDDWGGAAASSGNTLLVSTGAVFSGFWLYSPS